MYPFQCEAGSESQFRLASRTQRQSYRPPGDYSSWILTNTSSCLLYTSFWPSNVIFIYQSRTTASATFFPFTSSSKSFASTRMFGFFFFFESYITASIL